MSSCKFVIFKRLGENHHLTMILGNFNSGEKSVRRLGFNLKLGSKVIFQLDYRPTILLQNIPAPFDNPSLPTEASWGPLPYRTSASQQNVTKHSLCLYPLLVLTSLWTILSKIHCSDVQLCTPSFLHLRPLSVILSCQMDEIHNFSLSV